MSGRERIRCKKATEIIFWGLHGYNSTIQYYQYAKKETMERSITVTIGKNDYQVNYPNVGNQIDIEILKSKIALF